MTRALIFSLNYYPFVGGAEVSIKEITDRIPDIDFHLIAYRFDANLPKVERVGNVTVHRIGIGKRGMTVEESFSSVAYLAKILYVPLAALKGLNLNRRYRFDFYWAMMSYMVFPITLMRMLGNRTPYLLTLQDGDPFRRVFRRKRIRPFLPLLAYGYNRAAEVQAISTSLLTWAHKLGFQGKGILIPNGTDVRRFSEKTSAEERAHIREELGLKPGETALVSTSRLVHKNALDVAIRSLSLLPPSVRFINFGFGPDREKLTLLAKEMHVEDRVSLLPHPGVPELPKYLHACDIFIRASRSEGMGVSFIEAMAAGLPVIATQEGGIADFLFDENRNPEKPTTGWAVDLDSAHQVAGAVEEILSRPDKVAEVTRTARELVLAKYDWNTIARDMQAVFANVSV